MIEASGAAPAPVAPARVGALAPLTVPAFRALWIAALISNIGSWMQTVGAQWFLVEQHGSPLLIALVQTASAAPVLLLGIPAGVIGELLNRRTLLIWVQATQVAIGGVLVVLTMTGEMSPYLLLALTLALGAASAVQLPAYGAISAEIVPTPFIPNAASLSSISVNVARAIGPAIAGALVSLLGVAFVFALNAASFAVFLVVLLAWRGYRPLPHGFEPFLDATRAGVRYVRNAGIIRALYLRLGLFIVPASALYALLPLLATQRLGLDATGYGVLLAGVGAGSIVGAFTMPRVRDAIGVNRTVLVCTLVFGAGMVGTALSPWPVLSVVILAVGGAGWIGVIATLNGAVQSFLPSWVRTRGLSIYQMVLFGSTAAGSALAGAIAGWTGSALACLGAGVVVVLVALSQLALPLAGTAHIPRGRGELPLPQLSSDGDIDENAQTLVLVRYRVDDENRSEFLARIALVEHSRRRTGARSWTLYADREQPGMFVEAFDVGSWREHLSQHAERLTGYDEQVIQAAQMLAVSVDTEHLIATGRAPHPARD
jgi:MFS family permease